MHKNWSAICAEPNPRLKQFISQADPTDDRLISGLAAGFPGLFSETPTGDPIPLSVLRQHAKRLGYDPGRNLRFAADSFEIPLSLVLCYYEDLDYLEGEGLDSDTSETKWPYVVQEVGDWPAGLSLEISGDTARELDQSLSVGQLFDHEGSQYLLIAKYSFSLYLFVPAERVDTNS